VIGMKGRMLTILLCGIIVLGITSCGSTKNEFGIGNKSDIKISQNDVTMSIKNGTLTNTSATLILTNHSDKKFQYGNPYEIEIKKDGEWHKINAELYFTMPAFQLSAKESKEIELNWKYGYGKLEDGTYRIIKGIDYEYEEGKYESFNVTVEFTIGKKQDDTKDNENNLDFYITKPEIHNDIRFNDYYMEDNRTIYLAGNLEEFYIKEKDKEITLKTYLSTAYQTIDDGIKHITDQLELKNTLRDGGTKIYKSKEKDITIIVCNTTKNDKNILIGDYSMKYTEGDCRN